MENGHKKFRFSGFGNHWKTKHLLLLYYKHVLPDCITSVPEQTVLRDYSVYSYSEIRSIERAPPHLCNTIWMSDNSHNVIQRK